MTYSEFGLDNQKVSQESGEIQDNLYDPWAGKHVGGRAFYLCFSNWVLSLPEAKRLAQEEPQAAEQNSRCFKCMKPATHLYHFNRDPTQHGICITCAADALAYLSKPPTIPLGTQFNLF